MMWAPLTVLNPDSNLDLLNNRQTLLKGIILSSIATKILDKVVQRLMYRDYY